jgi:hypothetical protein
MMQMKKSLPVATLSLFFSLCLHTIAQGQSKVVKKGKTHDTIIVKHQPKPAKKLAPRYAE